MAATPIAGGLGPSLKFSGTTFVAGHFGTWAQIGVEATCSGYDVAWKDPSTGLYTVWAADSAGNYVSNVIGQVPGTNGPLESLETTFNQDLNGDGTIGIIAATIEALGTKSLAQSAATTRSAANGA